MRYLRLRGVRPTPKGQGLFSSNEPPARHRSRPLLSLLFLPPAVLRFAIPYITINFEPFLNKALNLLPALLRKRDLVEERDNELLDMYLLLLDCFCPLLPLLEAKLELNARKICSCVDLNWDDGPSIFLEVLRITLELSLCECKMRSDFFVGCCYLVRWLDGVTSVLREMISLILLIGATFPECYRNSAVLPLMPLGPLTGTRASIVPSKPCTSSSSIEAVLANVGQICYNYLVKSMDISNDALENIKETISDGYKRIGSTILLFHERHPGNITSIADITVCTLFEMSLVDDLQGIKSDSLSLVKEWVKVLCKEYKDDDKKYDAPFLYHLLLKKKDKSKWPKMSLGRIIEKRDAKSDSCNGQALVYHQLATAYCLHAQCAQEGKLDFKVILGEIDSALDLWLRIDIEHYTCGDGGFEMVATNMVPMLCSLIDLLSIKGCYKHHSRICKLIEKTFKRESIPVDKLFALLFSDRRIGHTNCGVQMDVELISDVLQNCDASLLHRKFEFSPKKPDVPLKRRDSVSTETWPDFTRADTIMDSFLSRWIVLRFYLESTFQQLWDMADSELRRAQKLLEESELALSCKNCKMFLETTVNLQLGDLLRSRFKNRSLEDALCTYQSAFDKLDHHELEFPKKEEAETNKQLNSTCKCCMLLNKKASNSDTKKLMRTTRARSCKTSTVTKTKEEPATEFNNSKKMGKKPSPKCNGDVSCNEQ
ncbi:Separase [Carex littledalei]|uniref:Separase n=1 Tax=Carex littledalei TaxID=544730 RepID=A0A833W0V5_9POAL|nr:Separase [Carex littledalei]